MSMMKYGVTCVNSTNRFFFVNRFSIVNESKVSIFVCEYVSLELFVLNRRKGLKNDTLTIQKSNSAVCERLVCGVKFVQSCTKFERLRSTKVENQQFFIYLTWFIVDHGVMKYSLNVNIIIILSRVNMKNEILKLCKTVQNNEHSHR